MKSHIESIPIDKYFPFFWVGVSVAVYLIVLLPIHFLFQNQVVYSLWSSIFISLFLGIAQWLLLRKYVPAAVWWLIITFIGGVSSFASVFTIREMFRLWPDVALSYYLPSWFQEFVSSISGNHYIDIVIANILLAIALFGSHFLRSFGLVFLQWLFLRQIVTGAWKWLVSMPVVIILAGLLTALLVNVFFRLPIGIRELNDLLWFKLLFAGIVQLPILTISGFVMKNLLEKPKQYIEETVNLRKIRGIEA